MVYLGTVIKKNRELIYQYNNIETVAYLYASSFSNVSDIEIGLLELSPEESIALKGYKNEAVTTETIASIISKPPIKGIDATSNVFKFAGLYLGAKDRLHERLVEKFDNADVKDQFFLSKIEPNLNQRLFDNLDIDADNPFSIIVNHILNKNEVSENDLNNSISRLINGTLDVQSLLLLEFLEKHLLEVRFISKNSEQILREIFYNFSNAVQKIIKDRRKGHPQYQIEDEYDVQDILYVIIKSIFPNMRDEDSIAKVGAKSTKIDFILREEEILIEVKMIKKGDSNEKHFIEQLKVDFESYHKCVWLNKLFCFVYDPYKKTGDISNFNDLNGQRVKGSHSYNVEIIVVN